FNCDKLIILNQGKILYDGTINKFIDMVEVYSVVVSNDEFEYLGAGIALSSILDTYKGEVSIIGTPAEETGDGKPYLIEHGVFDG
ncbi:hypothetical protein ACTPEM_25890, partial [Clostridioides difficile]